MEIKTNVVFEHLVNSDKKITVEQGGSRSGKTYNILIWIIFHYCYHNEGKIITICRKTFPALRGSVMRDFIEILEAAELYDVTKHNKTHHEYELNGNLIEFIGLDQPQKVRGRKRNLLFINEANELYFEDWQQLIMRTTEKAILDYNPSEVFHWIYDRVIPREDADFFKTTYLDNPSLDESVRKEIELLKTTDEDYWRIYGLGERGVGRAAIFQFSIVDEIPKDASLLSYGLDFGYTNDQTALVAVYKRGNELYIKELLYKTHLTNPDIAQILTDLGVGRKDEIYADSSEPKSIEELYRFGFNVKPTVKGTDSVNAGIDMLKRHQLFVLKSSSNMIMEMQNYKWVQDKNGQLLNKPIDTNNHLCDALRYAVWNKINKPFTGKYSLR